MAAGRILAMVALLALSSPAFGQDLAGDGMDAAPIVQVPASLDADGQAAVEGINAFSLDLYRRTLISDRNHFLSPASVSVAVGLAYRGARGTTAVELEKTLRFGKPPRDYLRANAQILETMNLSGPKREMRTANAIWLQEGMPLAPDFAADIAHFAKAGVQRVDFPANPDDARKKVNDWVAERTRNRIKDLVTPVDVTKFTRAILVNAVYWKDAWTTPFDKASTRPRPFTQMDGQKRETPMMEQRRLFQVVQRGGVKAILLPYVGGEVEMAVFLPSSAEGLPRLDRS